MAESKLKLPWLRILADGTTIVASILLAFAIDAWWQGRAEQRHTDALLRGLLTDFRATQAHAEQWLAGNRKVLESVTAFRDQMEATRLDDELTVQGAWLLAALSTPTYSPTDATLAAALSAGDLDLIANPELRSSLAAWRTLVNDTQEDEVLIREIVVHQLIPILSRQVRLGPALHTTEIVNWFLNQDAAVPADAEIRATSELEGALAERVFYTQFVVWGLTDLHESQARIIRLLEAELNP